jgi:molecular chaperone GrpE
MASETTTETINGTTPAADADGREQVVIGDIADSPDDIAALRAENDALKQQLAEEKDSFLRARADYINLKRRSEEERDNLKQFVTGDLLLRLLPAVDNMERALNAAAQTNDYEKLVGGINAVHKQLTAFMEKEGVTPIPALNQPFDPNLHNAVLRDEESDQPENTIVEELQKGYLLGDRVLRPTMVRVSVKK